MFFIKTFESKVTIGSSRPDTFIIGLVQKIGKLRRDFLGDYYNGLPFLDSRDGHLRITVMFALHGSVHVGKFDLPSKIHVDCRGFYSGIREVLHRIS